MFGRLMALILRNSTDLGRRARNMIGSLSAALAATLITGATGAVDLVPAYWLGAMVWFFIDAIRGDEIGERVTQLGPPVAEPTPTSVPVHERSSGEPDREVSAHQRQFVDDHDGVSEAMMVLRMCECGGSSRGGARFCESCGRQLGKPASDRGGAPSPHPDQASLAERSSDKQVGKKQEPVRRDRAKGLKRMRKRAGPNRAHIWICAHCSTRNSSRVDRCCTCNRLR